MPWDAAPLITAWVLASPFVVATAIGSAGGLRRLIARAYPVTIVLGWAGVLGLVAGALVLGSPVAMAAGAPFAGLAIWTPGPGGDDGGEGDDPPPDDDPDEPGVDWDAFDRARAGWRPRHPVAG